MKPQISKLKLEKQANLSDYELVINIIKIMQFRNETLRWNELCKKFRGYNLKVDMFGGGIFIYGLVFNDFLIRYNNGGSYLVKDIYKIGKKYFKFVENIGKFAIFKKVNKKEIIGMPVVEYERRKWLR